jgi:outer membrane protein assembly factor BamB
MPLRRILWLALFISAALGAADSRQGYWPQWRGPQNNGMAPGDAPLRWSSTENVRWTADIPGRGFSSPVVWGDRIFLTTAIPTGTPPAQTAPAPPPEAPPPGAPPEGGRGGRGGRGGGGFGRGSGPLAEHRFEVLCLDRRTGKILWQRTAKTATPHEGHHATYGSFASNSPVTDGERVYAFFGSRGLYCYDLEGKLLWEKQFVPMKIRLGFGEGTAPVLEGDRLIIEFDHEGESFITALDKRTGKEVWRTSRDEMTNWAMPLVVEHGGKKQIVTSATRKVRSYDLETGKLIWECTGLGLNTIPAPVAAGGLVIVMSGFRDPNLLAIRLGREGDLTGTDAIVWTNTRGNSYTPSPLLFEGKLYVLTDNGFLSCFDAATGKPYYQQMRLPKTYSFKASPVGAGGKLYLATENEDVVVVRLGEKFEVLQTNTMPDQVFIATPAVAAGELILRSQNKLYAIAADGAR